MLVPSSREDGLLWLYPTKARHRCWSNRCLLLCTTIRVINKVINKV